MKNKVIWPLDPLILTDRIGVYELFKKVENIGNQLKDHIQKLVFSFANIRLYKKVQNNLRNNAVLYREFDSEAMNEFAAKLKEINEKWHLEIVTCAEHIPLEKHGIIRNKCVDDDLMIKLFSHDSTLMVFWA